ELSTPTARAEDEGGYARELTADEAGAQAHALAGAIPRFDVVITTAMVPGGPPPLLVTADALAGMRPGSVVIDLASTGFGGNVEGSVPDTRTVTDQGVTVIGAAGLASTVPMAASTAYARNVLALLALLMPGGEVALDLDDEIQRAVIVSHGGRVVQPRVRALLEDSKEI
ncbi:NAD(P) transhydrogenase subunit alpha, partial [Actinoplanes sp. KI2]|nr:NAD(P) transhydrogenase subunit alpha [Actinoplanes sp. KI2]